MLIFLQLLKQNEEEEFTSRIIQYFSTGLLTLPDGATLRSYLAEKLNCDPMRITKKFTGACCLGRRAYHLRDRPRASPAEVEMARMDLQHLEQRFRLRVEHEQTGLPLPPRHEIFPAQPRVSPSVVQSSLYPMPTVGNSASGVPWLQPSSHPGVAVNSVVAAPGVLTNQAVILNSLTVGSTAGANLTSPGINLQLPAPSVAPTAVAALQTAAQQRLPQLAAGPLQQLILQAAAQAGANDRYETACFCPFLLSCLFVKVFSLTDSLCLYFHNLYSTQADPSVQLLNSLLASVALAQAASALNQVPVTGPAMAAVPSPVATPSVASHASSFQAPVSAFTKAASGQANGMPPSLLAASHLAQSALLLQSPQTVVLPHHKDATASLVSPSAIAKPVPEAPKTSRASQLKAAYEKQQEALRLAYEKTLKDHEAQEKEQEKQAGATSQEATKTAKKALSPAEQLQQTYEAHLASIQKAEKKAAPMPTAASGVAKAVATDGAIKAKKVKKKKISVDRGLPEEGNSRDEEAGTILLGFLNSLRGSYEDAVGDAAGSARAAAIAVVSAAKASGSESNGHSKEASVQGEKPSASSAKKTAAKRQSKKPDKRVLISSKKPEGQPGGKRKRGSNSLSASAPNRQDMQDSAITALMNSSQNKAKQVSETSSGNSSSQPSTEQSASSIEDSDSKSDKTDNTSGDETAEEEDGAMKRARSSTSKGPPRKRLKNMQEANKFTRANLLEHSKRMDRESQDSS